MTTERKLSSQAGFSPAEVRPGKVPRVRFIRSALISLTIAALTLGRPAGPVQGGQTRRRDGQPAWAQSAGRANCPEQQRQRPAAFQSTANATSQSPARTLLARLAARANEKTSWLALRRYAESSRSPEERGRAYLVLGYNEYAAHHYAPGAADLGRAAATGFQFADLAAFYEAASAQAAEQAQQVVQALQDFSKLYPHSFLRDRALEAKAKEFWDIIKIGRTHFNGCDTDSAWTGILRLRTAGRLCQRTRTKVG